ncbi:MAG: DUF2157 domain-containing protein [Acidobacteria bacterium]|nr:DUF2157 domain-containing protein [Acidobacteriota bacterium]
MEPDAHSQGEAQQRADRIRAFRGELERLEHEQVLVLTSEQRSRLDEHLDATLRRLASRFDIDTTESQKRFSWGMRIVSTLGALALCAAVFLFFYRFWGLLSVPVQVTLVVLLPLAALAAAELAARRETTLYYAALASIVAVGCFVLNLSVLGKIFNATPTQNALLAWGLFALALAYHYGLRLLLIAGLACLLSYLAATLVTWRGVYWFTFGERPENFIAGGLLVWAAPLAISHRRYPDFPPVFRFIGLLVLLGAVLILAESGSASYLRWEDRSVERLYEVVGLALSAGAIWLGIRRSWSGVVNLGASFFAFFLFLRLYRWLWDWIPKYVFFLLIGAVAIGLVALFKRLRARMPA